MEKEEIKNIIEQSLIFEEPARKNHFLVLKNIKF